MEPLGVYKLDFSIEVLGRKGHIASNTFEEYVTESLSFRGHLASSVSQLCCPPIDSCQVKAKLSSVDSLLCIIKGPYCTTQLQLYWNQVIGYCINNLLQVPFNSQVIVVQALLSLPSYHTQVLVGIFPFEDASHALNTHKNSTFPRPPILPPATTPLHQQNVFKELFVYAVSNPSLLFFWCKNTYLLSISSLQETILGAGVSKKKKHIDKILRALKMGFSDS